MAFSLLTWLGNQTWFNVGANIIQWISGPGTLAAVLTFLWMRWRSRCAVKFCVRVGHHEVKDTRWKVCHKHHMGHHHSFLAALHKEKHPEYLTWGESHDN